ncbi:MAG TPA: DUF885 family protein, partial [Candidatus Nanopelagicales bacterium]|nr:DUF885 family protein [Candidatus Nanopelagicales bacterium]
MSAIFDLADRVIQGTAQDDPVAATFYGVAGLDDRLTDFSPSAEDARNARVAGWLAELDGLPAERSDDRLAAAHLQERLGVRRSMYDAGDHLRDCNALGCPVQGVQLVFGLM